MGSKNLARTAIEGGRCGFNKIERKLSTSAERAAARAWLASPPPGGPGDDSDEKLAPRRRPVGQCFHDKLSAPERWLRAQVGRRWDTVHSELMQRFDTRTIAGRHIVFDHLLPWVKRCALGERWHFHIVEVDKRGILRLVPRRKRVKRYVPRTLTRPALADFAAGRKVGARGELWFWFVPAPLRWIAEASGARAPGFRQDRRLDEDEVAVWKTLSAEEQEKLAFNA